MTVQSMFSKIAKAAVALPVVAAGLAFNAGSAEAGALIGAFQIEGNGTLINLSSDEIDFVHEDYDPEGYISLTAQTGGFVGIETALIKDLIPIDLEPIADFLVFDDGSTFTVESNGGLTVEDSIPGFDGLVSLGVGLIGTYTSSTGELSQGLANITFQFAEMGVNAEEFQARLDAGEEFTQLALSGSGIAITEIEAVPEPATILGLVTVAGLAGASIRKRKEA